MTETTGQEHVSITEREARMMAQMAPLVDAVLEDRVKASDDLFLIGDVVTDIQNVFEMKQKDAMDILDNPTWHLLIRGRMSKLGFDTVTEGGNFGWRLMPAVE